MQEWPRPFRPSQRGCGVGLTRDCANKPLTRRCAPTRPLRFRPSGFCRGSTTAKARGVFGNERNQALSCRPRPAAQRSHASTRDAMASCRATRCRGRTRPNIMPWALRSCPSARRKGRPRSIYLDPLRCLGRGRDRRMDRIKQSCSYDQNEIAKLFGIRRNTVRHWIKAGLRTIDDRRPLLVHGSALKSFLDARQQARRHKCAPGEFFCFRCRAPRQLGGNVADAAPHTEKVQKLTALCSVCETTMHRTIRRADIPKLAGLIDIRSMAEEGIGDCPDTSANSDFKRGRPDVETERAK